MIVAGARWHQGHCGMSQRWLPVGRGNLVMLLNELWIVRSDFKSVGAWCLISRVQSEDSDGGIVNEVVVFFVIWSKIQNKSTTKSFSLHSLCCSTLLATISKFPLVSKYIQQVALAKHMARWYPLLIQLSAPGQLFIKLGRVPKADGFLRLGQYLHAWVGPQKQHYQCLDSVQDGEAVWEHGHCCWKGWQWVGCRWAAVQKALLSLLVSLLPRAVLTLGKWPTNP